jgi:hypothetical protein
MGTNKYTYAGCLLKIKPIEKEVEEYSHHQCTNEKCKSKCKSKFCPNCGSPTVVKYKTVKKVIDYIGDILSDNSIREDLFYKPGKSEYYIENSESLIDCDTDEFIFEETFLVSEKIKEFKEKYRDILLILEQTFGEIEVKFGIISYWS